MGLFLSPNQYLSSLEKEYWLNLLTWVDCNFLVPPGNNTNRVKAPLIKTSLYLLKKGMKIIENLKIRDKLILLLLILLLPLLYFVYNVIDRETQESRELEDISNDLTESRLISNLIHEFQKERARIIPASEGDSIFLVEAMVQRSNTNDAERALKKFLDNTNRSFSDINLISELEQYRSQLDNNTLNTEQFRNYSNLLLSRFLYRIDDNATSINNVHLTREMLSIRYLIETKVQFGRSRTLLVRVFKNDSLTYTDYAQLVTLRELHRTALENFNRYASLPAQQELKKILSSKAYQAVWALTLQLERNPAIDLGPYDHRKNFLLFTSSVESFSRLEGSMLTSINKQVEEENSGKHRALSFFIGLLIFSLILAAMLAFYIISLISNSLTSLRKASDQVRLGAIDVVINIDSTDEIGEVAQSFRGVVQKNIALTKVVQAIGAGKYDVEVEVHSKQDILSAAIKEMKDNLQYYTRESANRDWVVTGIGDLNTIIAGDTVLEGVAEKVISFMCNYSKSDAGIIYLYNEGGNLQPAASYGINANQDQLPAYPLGHGQVGQAVAERKIKILENVSQEYLRFETGIAKINPATIAIVPLYFNEAIVGALELGARKPYNDLDQDFFRNAADRISILMHSLYIHLRTQELLYETQNQAEELETQQEELRQLNAELKASEEELKVSQEELQEKNSELEEKAQQLEEQFEAVHNKNQALEDAREAIELKMQQVETVSKYKSDFLANMSHELRTPLNSILILSRLLADNNEQTLSEKQAEHAMIIHRSGADLLKLINEILDLSKIESGQIKLELEEVKLKELAIQDSFNAIAASKNIAFDVAFAAGMNETITTDRFRLQQILRNFLSNAFKFTPTGGKVTLSVFPLQDKKTFHNKHLKEYKDIIAFAVSDSGVGISQEKQELVFEAFQQADTSTTRKFGGTGLGLTISRELATLLGGEIELKSEEGKGSTFTLYLPQNFSHSQDDKPEIKKSENLQNRVTPINRVFEEIDTREKKEISLLIIEDDKGFNEVLTDFSLAKKFKVHQAYTGRQGLQLAKEVKPDAILLDINLPDITGWDVLKQIREDSALRHVNVHVMSAYDREVVGNHQEHDEYLPKPVTLEMLNKAFTTIGSSTNKSIENILIVEDNEVENKAIGELLLSHGLNSVSAYSTEEAEQILARQKIDCIILDLNLPGTKGNVWMESIRAKKGLSNIPIIIYSGKDLSETEEARLKQYANTIIIKNEYSYMRLLDEVQLFLHKVNQKLPVGKDFTMKLHVPEEVLLNKKALVVDDDVRNVYSLCSMLELQGMEIVVAYNGNEALEKLEAIKDIDVVLMDVMMPEMDGIEAIKRIRQEYQFKQLPIIALTAKAMKGDREKCLEAGASDYITKPVDIEKLLSLMRVWLYEA